MHKHAQYKLTPGVIDLSVCERERNISFFVFSAQYNYDGGEYVALFCTDLPLPPSVNDMRVLQSRISLYSTPQ